ncbi:MAG: hypothetical protein IPP14_02425 [Planctomycetes bacterium]|nr:hypothetical protein [Planctomycetota bacterium]
MPDFYQFSLSGGDLDLDVTVNGFPLHAGELDGSAAMVLNPYLIGKGNQLRCVVRRRGPDATLNGALQVMQPGDIADSLASGGLALPQGPAPLDFSQSFDAKIAPFQPILQAAAAATPQQMLPFALVLRDLLRKRDKAGFMNLLQPKIDCYAAAFDEKPQAMRGDIEAGIAAYFNSDLDFELQDLVATPWCENKVFELRRSNGKALVYMQQEDGSMSMQVFVALINGKPAIVS